MSWDEIFSSQGWGRWPDLDAVRAVSRAAAYRDEPLSVLEVGCGPGAQLWYLGHEGHRAIGLDFSAVALEQAQRRLLEEQVAGSLVRGDAAALPFGNSRFDVVLDVEAFAHCPANNLQAMWIEAARVLNREGLFVSIGFTTNSRDPSEGSSEPSPHPLAGKGDVVFLEEQQVRRLGRVAGFAHLAVDHRVRTLNNGQTNIEEFICIASQA